jgi:hypothetical protein
VPGVLPYLKLFTEARKDLKLRSLPLAQRWVWFNLLCYCAEQPRRGTVHDIPARVVAVEVADGDLDLLVTTCNALQDLSVVTWRYCNECNVEVTLLNFEKRQAGNALQKPSSERIRVRERVAKCRARKRSVNVTPVTPDVTPDVTPVTPVTRPRVRASDGDLDGDKEEEPPYGGGAAGAAVAGGNDPRSVLPPDLEGSIELARDRFGDKIASMLAANGQDIAATLGGRFDLYLAALDRARDYGKPIRDLHRFAIGLARQYARTGLPAEPVPLAPRNGTNGHVLRARAQDDAFERALEEID